MSLAFRFCPASRARWRGVLVPAAALLAVMTLAATTVHAQRFDALARFGSHVLRATPSARELQIALQAGGETATRDLRMADACRGYIDPAAPTVRIDYVQHGQGDVVFEVQSDAPTMLVVNGSDGVWYCAQPDPDGRTVMRLSRPNSGQIDLWVGTPTAGSQAAHLRVFATE